MIFSWQAGKMIMSPGKNLRFYKVFRIAYFQLRHFGYRSTGEGGEAGL
jgi:hypothetical protein